MARREPGVIWVAIPSSPWLTLREAAARAGLSPRTLKVRLGRLAHEGEKTTCGHGPHCLIHQDVLDSLLVRRFLVVAGAGEPDTAGDGIRGKDCHRCGKGNGNNQEAWQEAVQGAV